MAEQTTPPTLSTGPRAKAPERRSLMRRVASFGRRWARDTFNREQLVSSLKSLAWVAPLTLLIWIYAEREQQVTGTATFQIALQSDPTQVARVVSAADETITANIKGPKARMEDVARKLDTRSGGGPVQIVVEGSRPPGTYDIDILAQVQRDRRFGENGITVLSCHPGAVRVEIDALESAQVPVKPPPGTEQSFLSATFEPQKVQVVAPAGAMKQARAKGPLVAQANIPPSLPPGRQGPMRLQVTVPELGERNVSVMPSTVQAMLEVRQADDSWEIRSLPVSAVVSGELTHNYEVKYSPLFLPNVKVYGPADRIQQLKDGKLSPKPEARFKATALDVGKRVTRELEYVLPPGFEVGKDAPKTIDFELVPREAS